MTDPSRVPVIVGVADVRSGRAGSLAAPREPLELIADAVHGALGDSAIADVGSRVDTIYAVRTASWSYDDLPASIAERIGADSPRTWTSPIGGHWPAALLDRIGSEIADGSSTVALLVGGEAQASLKELTKQGADPASRGWTTAPGGPPTFTADDLGSDEMQRAGVLAPTRVYPLFENRLSYELGHSPTQSRRYSAEMYAKYSELAADHSCAWMPTARTPEDIATSGPENRLVSDVYPLAMNAMPFVDQAAAVLVCSLASAVESGVPEDRIVYLWGGAGASDPIDVIGRNDFGTSVALTSAVDRTLRQAGVNSSDLGIIDAYSCFPVVPKLLIRALGLPSSTVLSVLGGHSFFGGPLNSYTLHAIAEVTRQLRNPDGPGVDKPALVHANGGYLTHQHTVLLAGTPHIRGYVGDSVPQALSATAPPIVHGYDGDAVIETATVDFDREHNPRSALIIARTPEGSRVAGHTDSACADALVRYTQNGDRSMVGADITITDHDGAIAVVMKEEAHT
ncbi:MAG: acetyl-CoA acetyltransferase [Rhodococcus sp. (in: high G+C Gram-positive bacteria)]